MIVRRPPLTELAWYLAHAAWYVGNDSGVSHLAGVLDTPGTVFFGPTDPAAWRPLGETIELVRFQGVRATRGQPETSAIADKEEPQ
jgi:ADP-heptose:LPS heptosyltransferase